MAAVSDHQYCDDLYLPSGGGVALHVAFQAVPRTRQTDAQLGRPQRRSTDHLRHHVQGARGAVCRSDLQCGIPLHNRLALGARHDADVHREEAEPRCAAERGEVLAVFRPGPAGRDPVFGTRGGSERVDVREG